jgi:hypothetical protein
LGIATAEGGGCGFPNFEGLNRLNLSREGREITSEMVDERVRQDDAGNICGCKTRIEDFLLANRSLE